MTPKSFFFLKSSYSAGTILKTKKAFITILLVEETEEKSNRKIEEEIMRELSEHLSVIPWAKDVQSVNVE